MVRSILKKNKITKKLKKELLRPTKIYTKEILKLVNKNLINAAAHITGGGLIENVTRSIPSNLSVNINLVSFSIYLQDINGQIFTMLILTVAAAEAAIGLAIIVAYYRNKGSIRVEEIDEMKG